MTRSIRCALAVRCITLNSMKLCAWSMGNPWSRGVSASLLQVPFPLCLTDVIFSVVTLRVPRRSTASGFAIVLPLLGCCRLSSRSPCFRLCVLLASRFGSGRRVGRYFALCALRVFALVLAVGGPLRSWSAASVE
eukprot:5926676-Prymnesium_polylepis.1